MKEGGKRYSECQESARTTRVYLTMKLIRLPEFCIHQSLPIAILSKGKRTMPSGKSNN